MGPLGNNIINSNVGEPFGVPKTFTMQTSNSRTFNIQKGQLNKYKLRPAIFNEHVEPSRAVQGMITATNIVGQIFKASQDNINGINLTLQSAAFEAVDDFEAYADSAALQAAWVLTGTNQASLETTIVKDPPGQSIHLPLSILSDEWAKTIGSKNYTDYTFSLDFYQDRAFSLAKVSLVLEDGSGNTTSAFITIQNINTWEHIHIDVNALSDDGAATDLTDIVKILFRVDDQANTFSAYVDNITATPAPGSILLKLWDMGTEIPEGAVTSIDDGTQYTELGDRGLNGGTVSATVILPLVGGRRLYSIRQFVAGPALEIPDNTILEMGHYYAITMNYVDTEVNVFGSDPSFATNYYENGYAFTAPDEATAITKVGEFNDCMFVIFSTQRTYLNTLVKFYRAVDNSSVPLGALATEIVFIEDEGMKISGMIAGENTPQVDFTAEFRDRVYEIRKGGKFEIYHNDDFMDDTAQVTVLVGYIYEPQEVNG